LYGFNPLNKANFHESFDDHENIVIIVKTKQGCIFGGWSEGPFTQSDFEKTKKKNGLLFSVSNKKSYKLNSNKPAIIYDK
jgi:hypothetical protein